MARVTHRRATNVALLFTTTRAVERSGWPLLALCCISCSSSNGKSSGNLSTAGVGSGAVPSASSGTGGAAVGMPAGGTSGAMATGRAPMLGAGSGGASGPGPAPRDAAAEPGGSDVDADTGGLDAAPDAGGLDAAVATPDASVDAGVCAMPAGTAAESGFLGDWAPGTYPSNFRGATAGNYLTLTGLPNQAGMAREYAVHVPAGYDKGTPLPALFCLHAALMNARSFCDNMAGWLAKADKENFILIMPNGYMNTFNIGPLCGAALLPAFTAGLDDVGFVRALLEQVGTHVNIDLGRVYAAGFSNGSALAWRLACDASDIFAAVAPISAGPCLETCKPSHKVSVLDIYGGADALNPTEGLARATAAVRAVNGCSMTTMPAAVPKPTGSNACLTSTGCTPDACSPVEVTECVVRNGGHCWYGNISTADCGPGAADSEFFATNLVWEFLKRFSR